MVVSHGVGAPGDTRRDFGPKLLSTDSGNWADHGTMTIFEVQFAKRALFEFQTRSHLQPLAATRVAASGCKWPQGGCWSKCKWPQVAASGRKWPQVAASGRKWPQVAASGRKWPQVAASGRKWPQVATGRKGPLSSQVHGSHLQPLAGTRVAAKWSASGCHLQARKWPQVAECKRCDFGTYQNETGQVAASGRKWPQVAASASAVILALTRVRPAKWPQVAASGRKWPQVAASGRKWPLAARGLLEQVHGSHLQPLAATCRHSSGRKWLQVAASVRNWSKWLQVAGSGHKWPLEQVATSARKWPEVAASGGRKWSQVAASSCLVWVAPPHKI